MHLTINVVPYQRPIPYTKINRVTLVCGRQSKARIGLCGLDWGEFREG